MPNDLKVNRILHENLNNLLISEYRILLGYYVGRGKYVYTYGNANSISIIQWEDAGMLYSSAANKHTCKHEPSM